MEVANGKCKDQYVRALGYHVDHFEPTRCSVVIAILELEMNGYEV
jgi:hypothetical protein